MNKALMKEIKKKRQAMKEMEASQQKKKEEPDSINDRDSVE